MNERFENWLLDCAKPRFGQVGLWLLLAFSLILSVIPFEFTPGDRAEVWATVFSWLPHSLLDSQSFFTAMRFVLAGSALLWLFDKWVPWSSWLCVFSFMLMWSLRMENVANGAHIFTVTNMLLFIYAMWYQFYYREILQAKKEGRFWETRLFPRWVFLLVIFYLGWFHTLAGFAKVFASGVGWGNGTSLQLWVHLFGLPESPSTQLMLYDNRLTACLQTGAMVIECLSVLAVFNRWARYLVGIGVVGFYMGVLTTFVDFGFHFNAMLTAWFLLPFDYWLKQDFSEP